MKQITLHIIFPLLLLLATAVTTYTQGTKGAKFVDAIEYSDRVINQSNVLKKLMLDLEESLRAYALTADPIFLNPYEQALGHLDEEFTKLREYTKAQSIHLVSIDEAESLSKTWRATVQLSTMKNKRYDPATFNKDPELKERMMLRKDTMEKYRDALDKIIQVEEKQKSALSSDLRSTNSSFSIVLPALFLLLGLVIGYSGRELFRSEKIA